MRSYYRSRTLFDKHKWERVGKRDNDRYREGERKREREREREKGKGSTIKALT